MTNKAHPNTLSRQAAETKGRAWLPVYIVAEKCCVSGATQRCFYCGFGLTEGHDFACLLLEAEPQAVTRGKGMAEVVFVPAGGLKRSNAVRIF